MWLAWLNDEKGVASTDEERKYVSSLYQRATTDFAHIDLWAGWLEWEQEILLDVEDQSHQKEGMDTLRRMKSRFL